MLGQFLVFPENSTYGSQITHLYQQVLQLGKYPDVKNKNEPIVSDHFTMYGWKLIEFQARM